VLAGAKAGAEAAQSTKRGELGVVADAHLGSAASDVSQPVEAGERAVVSDGDPANFGDAAEPIEVGERVILRDFKVPHEPCDVGQAL
jgi:hypothetical protein